MVAHVFFELIQRWLEGLDQVACRRSPSNNCATLGVFGQRQMFNLDLVKRQKDG